MKLEQLFERASSAIEEMHPVIEKICKLVFKTNAGPVSDTKKHKDPIYYGVANAPSVITDQDGNHLTLTFDNSTASGEFELNSLSPLGIVKGSDLDLEIRKLYNEHGLSSKRKLGYTEKSGQLVLREIYFGKVININALRFMQDLMANIKHEKKRVS